MTNDKSQDLRITAKEYADMLARVIADLEALSVGLSGGFEQARQEVKMRVEKGMPFPEALYEVSQEIVKGRIQ